MNRLGNIIFYVKDVAQTVEFFEKAFGIKRDFIDPTGMYAQMKTGSTALGFASEHLASQNLSKGFQKHDAKKLPFPCEISFCTKNAKKSLENALKAGATLVEDLKEKPWGQTIGYVRSPEGILIEIATEMACESVC